MSPRLWKNKLIKLNALSLKFVTRNERKDIRKKVVKIQNKQCAKLIKLVKEAKTVQKRFIEYYNIPKLGYKLCIQKRRNELIAGVDAQRIGFILRALQDGLNIIYADLEKLYNCVHDSPCNYDWSTATIKKIIKKGLKRL